MSGFDLVFKGATLVTAEAAIEADLAVQGGAVAAIGHGLEAAETIDARGRIITPGGVDVHCHVEQLSASGLINADTFASATASAALGGTTTVIPFAAQHVGMSLKRVVADYHALAKAQAHVDYAFHMIVTDPTPAVLDEELPALIAAGHGSIKCFMTYDRLRVDDGQLLDVLAAARRGGALVLVHAENHGLIAWMGKRLIERGHTSPKYHVTSHPRAGEAEAIFRAVQLASFIDQPLMIYHVSTEEGVEVIRAARAKGQKIFAETCTQYLALDAADLDRPGIEGAMWMCSPPLRHAADREALWAALADGTLQLVSSDHAPYRMDDTGKLSGGPNPTFKQIANGMPGLQLRLPVLFDLMVSQGRMGLPDFVRLTMTEPARIYNLHPKKGTLLPGADADLVVWDPTREVEITHDLTVDNAGYTPYVGRTLKGWPESVYLRGAPLVVEGEAVEEAPRGRFLPRGGGAAAAPTGRVAPELDGGGRFGADLL